MPGSGTEQLVLACACGSTLKVSSLKDVELLKYEAMWESDHPAWTSAHERVSPTEARRIRDTTKKRKAWLRKGTKVQ